MWLTEHGDFFRRGVWEPLLLLGAGEACLLAATESSWGAGLCFSALVRGRDCGPSRACMTLMAPTAPRSQEDPLDIKGQEKARSRPSFGTTA